MAQPQLVDAILPTEQRSDSLKPLVKWPGGKRWIVPLIKSLQPKSYKRYIEPFAGGAAVFFGLRPKNSVLSDLNKSLIMTYQTLATSSEDVIEQLLILENSKEEYYRVRSLKPQSDIEVAVRMLYLTRFSFNGIYRVNLQGQFNVPYGFKTHMSTYNANDLREYAQALQGVLLLSEDFRVMLKFARAGDFVYVDPPYTVAHNNNGFLKYNEKIFSWADQQCLAQQCKLAAKRGACVIVSNADHVDIRQLYQPEFKCLSIERYSSVSGSAPGRQHVSECLFIHKGK